jgi:hypothetical protein
LAVYTNEEFESMNSNYLSAFIKKAAAEYKQKNGNYSAEFFLEFFTSLWVNYK